MILPKFSQIWEPGFSKLNRSFGPKIVMSDATTRLVNKMILCVPRQPLFFFLLRINIYKMDNLSDNSYFNYHHFIQLSRSNSSNVLAAATAALCHSRVPLSLTLAIQVQPRRSFLHFLASALFDHCQRKSCPIR